MRIKDPLSEGEEPFNLVPLTDMVFNLLIFFMCATTFAQVEKDLAVQLPHTSSQFVPLSAAPKEFIINIRQDGSYVVAGKTYDQPGLNEAIKSQVKARPDTIIVIRADVRGYIRPFDTVTSMCYAAGVSTVKIVYIGDKSGLATGK